MTCPPGYCQATTGFGIIRARQLNDLSVVTLSACPKPEKFRMQEPKVERRASWRVPSRESCMGFLRASDDRGTGTRPFLSAKQPKGKTEWGQAQRPIRNKEWALGERE